MKTFRTLHQLAEAMRRGTIPMAKPGKPYPHGGYGFEIDKSISFRYWPSKDEPEEIADRKMEEAEQVFDLEAAYERAGIKSGNDDTEAFVMLFLHELGIAESTV